MPNLPLKECAIGCGTPPESPSLSLCARCLREFRRRIRNLERDAMSVGELRNRWAAEEEGNE